MIVCLLSMNLDVKQLITQGHQIARELHTCLHTTNIQNKEENQLRELHSWACKFRRLIHVET
jgi:hypothetical protein